MTKTVAKESAKAFASNIGVNILVTAVTTTLKKFNKKLKR